MTPAEQGRFCQSCAKEVVDFSMMTDQQVLNYFSKSAHNICGRFNNDQLNRPLQPTKIEKKKAWWVAAMMPLLMLVDKATAQKKNSQCDKPGIISQRTVGDTVLIGKVLAPGIKLARTVTGYVISTQGKPVPYAAIKFNNRYKTNADSLGAFKLTDILSEADNSIEVSSVGYKTGIVSISDTIDNYEVVLQEVAKELDPLVIVSYPGTHCGKLTMGTASVGLPLKRDTPGVKNYFPFRVFSSSPFTQTPRPATVMLPLHLRTKATTPFNYLITVASW